MGILSVVPLIWRSEMTNQICPFEVTRRYISDNAGLISRQHSNVVLGAIRARDFKRLASISGIVDYAKHNIDTVRILRQVEAFFKKNDLFAEETLCRKAAEDSFERGERLCRITNRRLDYFFSRPDRLDPRMVEYIDKCQSYIRRVLGSYSSFENDIPSLLRITSGATLLTPRARSLPFQKLKGRPAVTPQCEPLLRAAYIHFGYEQPKVTLAANNRVEFVPKSWKTHRAIACEPAGNVPFQLAFDGWAKKRLRRHGINLSTQENNQQHARLGSMYDDIATVDMSMASDTVSYNTVAWLLPDDWFRYLDRVRSPLFSLNGEVRKYAKFSSMGNGATFALETLIFASMLHAVGSRKGLAYGDDLTIESYLYPELIKLLKFFGFVPNLEKSFASGPFRESCGGDFYQGEDITPFYLRSVDAWDKPNACHNINGLAKLSEAGELWDYLSEMTSKLKLPLTPERDDTQYGVFIHPYHAYRRRLIKPVKGKNAGWVTSRGYRWKTSSITCRNSRALALWFLHRSDEDDRLIHNEHGLVTDVVGGSFESSRYTRPVEKFTVGWAGWVPPAKGISDHLFGWSEHLSPASAG